MNKKIRALSVLVLVFVVVSTMALAERSLDRSEPLGEDCKVHKWISSYAENKISGVVVRSGERCSLSIDATTESNYNKLLKIAKELRNTEPDQKNGTWFAYVREYLFG